MPVLQSRNWRATEGTDLNGGDYKLVVTGEVEVSRPGEMPVLAEAVPQGIVPNPLILDLSARVLTETGGTATSWENVTFEKPVREDQYRTVEIHGHATIPVEMLVP